MHSQVMYENSIIEPSKLRKILNQYVSEVSVTQLKEDNERVGLGIEADQEFAPLSFEVKKAMLNAESRKAEALNMLRLRETLR
ncbi:MAG: hypothetical protein OEX77_11430 [Candidatus Bathyarchaeota archaeon]|nr:hypothetical protein [Candidatus Bathyarchaeota archaeon]MDH5733342.1 hypothetical protein [Candidatus Bathyarchaeota archaeon]